MKNWPLARQILILFMLLTTVLGISVGVLYPIAVKQYLVDNVYSLLEEEFETLAGHIAFTEHRELLPVPASAPFFLQLLLSNYEYSFDMLVYSANGQLLGSRSTTKVPVADANRLFRMAASYSEKGLQRGTLQRSDETYLFVSKRMDYHGFPYYLIVFSKEQELNQINAILTRQFIVVFAILLAVSWVLAIWFSRYLTNPLRRLGEWCQNIARRQFDIPLKLDRQDEIGELARSFETMKNQLKEYDESQRHFVQNISHELKTPIMAIQGYAHALQEGVFQGEQAEKGLQIIMEESKRLEKVVEQLLYLTKIESVSEMLQKKPLNLSELFSFLQQRLSVLNPSVAWDNQLPPVLQTVGDGEQLSIAFQNIIENQLRYAKQTLLLQAQRLPNQLQLIIANDGPPIDEQLLPHLFQRFRKGKSGKHGLGLAIARAVIEAHGGTIQAKNEPPGVRFIISLPTDAERA
ncbi:HAMP domain-containing histidine kinase [Brevibacillus humidisoli]|nr:HAMP domain-containing sensor histidine kinase [Brevibacillus humidisoli]UFJ41027.1 HAMP domain-containing histidine kinase [Brevibacillus humidisoli]